MVDILKRSPLVQVEFKSFSGTEYLQELFGIHLPRRVVHVYLFINYIFMSLLTSTLVYNSVFHL